MSHPLILVPKEWTRWDRLRALAFPRRRATVLPAVWLDELAAKRFGCLMICPGCAWKYQDGIRRHGFVQHPEMRAQGNACDACKRVVQWMSLFFPEEKRGYLCTTAAERSAESRRAAVLTDTRLFRRAPATGRPRLAAG